MALPVISQSNRQPTSFVAPALDAFLAVSRDFREENKASNQAFLGGQTLQLNRQAGQRAEDANVRAEERQDVFLEKAEFEREVLRPLQVESLQLRTQAQAFDLNSRRNSELLKGQEINQFQRQTQLLRGAFTGKLEVGGQSVFDTEIQTGEGGVGTAGDNIKENTVYWDHKNDRALLASVGPNKNTVLVDKSGAVIQPGEKLTLSRVKSFEPGEIRNIDRTLSQTQSPGSVGDMRQLDRIRNTNAVLEQMKITFAGTRNRSIQREIATMDAALQRDPFFQLAKARGQLEHPLMQEFNQQKNVEDTMSLLQLEFGDEGANDFAENNPSTMKTLADMTPAIRASQVGQIAKRQRDEEKEDPEAKKRRAASIERNFEISATDTLIRSLETEKLRQQQQGESRGDSEARIKSATKDIDAKIDKAEDELRKLRSQSSARSLPGDAGFQGTPTRELDPESFVNEFLQ